MKYGVAPLKNTVILSEALTALKERPHSMPGMGVVFGPPGYGKTTAVDYLSTRDGGHLLIASATWSVATLVGQLADAVGARAGRSAADTLTRSIEELQRAPAPIFIDEVDRIIEQRRLIELIREIYDRSECPVVLVGMDGLRAEVARYPQLDGRIGRFVEFQPADLDDAAMLAATLCEVRLSPEFLARIHGLAGGEPRQIVKALQAAEEIAQRDNLEALGPEHVKEASRNINRPAGRTPVRGVKAPRGPRREK